MLLFDCTVTEREDGTIEATLDPESVRFVGWDREESDVEVIDTTGEGRVVTPLVLTREEWSRGLRVAALEKDTALGADAAFALRRMGVSPTLPRRPQRTAKRVVKPRKMP